MKLMKNASNYQKGYCYVSEVYEFNFIILLIPEYYIGCFLYYYGYLIIFLMALPCLLKIV